MDQKIGVDFYKCQMAARKVERGALWNLLSKNLYSEHPPSRTLKDAARRS